MARGWPTPHQNRRVAPLEIAVWFRPVTDELPELRLPEWRSKARRRVVRAAPIASLDRASGRIIVFVKGGELPLCVAREVFDTLPKPGDYLVVYTLPTNANPTGLKLAMPGDWFEREHEQLI